MNRKYYRAKEIKNLFGINPQTLSRQRWGKYGLPYTVVGRKPGERRGGIILYNVDEVEDYLKKNHKGTRY
tara:strand:+ start:377 stop:586 length:210 start_codon:yes stop_codon:yes gene_type:complete